MTQQLYLVYGGELTDPSTKEFKDVKDVDLIGIYANYEDAYNAWKSKAHMTVDNAHARYFVAHLHRLDDEENADSTSEDQE